MKKTLLYMCAGFLISTNVNATCTNGTLITGNDGSVFCVSDVALNWWSAFAWCKAQNMNLATFEGACSNSSNINLCHNLKSKYSAGNAWIAKPSGNNRANYIEFYSGNITNSGRTGQLRALCM